MIKSKISSPLKLLLVVDDFPGALAAIGLLTHISWPARSSVHILTRVPGQLPQMETPDKGRSDQEEAVELSRWRDWALAREFTAGVAAPLRRYGLAVEIEICEGQLAGAALKHRARLAADLIVIGLSNPSGVGRSEMMPLGRKLLYEAPCSVLLVRPTIQVQPLSVILAVDDSAAAWQAVEFVRALSLSNWARVTVAHVIEIEEHMPAGETSVRQVPRIGQPRLPWEIIPGSPETCATEVVRRLHDDGVQGREMVRFGPAGDQILGAAREREGVLIVVGAHGRAQADPCRLGRVAQQVAHEAPCSVLVVR